MLLGLLLPVHPDRHADLCHEIFAEETLAHLAETTVTLPLLGAVPLGDADRRC